ncbi:MAG: pyruvate kinase [Phycisphaerales bacterium]|nr:pyruvate kinase [Phycisphaerales bacterium]
MDASREQAARLLAVAARLDELARAMDLAAAQAEERLSAIPGSHRASAANLIDYLTLRSFDIRELQHELACLGLSSLGRCESHVRAAIDAVRHAVARMLGEDRTQEPDDLSPPLSMESGRELLRRRSEELLGPVGTSDRDVRIMVTMPPEAADPVAGPSLLRGLAKAGMDIARINCAHDNEEAWRAMVAHAREALGGGRIFMDIPGPKVRTGRIEPGPAVASWHPDRDELGRVVAPALLQIIAEGRQDSLVPDLPWIAVPAAFAARLHPGVRVQLRDTRDKRRRVEICRAAGDGIWIAEAWAGGYAAPGTEIWCRGAAGRHIAEVTSTPRAEGEIDLQIGDSLLLTGDGLTGRPARRTPDGRAIEPARVACTLPEALQFVAPGHRVLLDDGKIAAVAVECGKGWCQARITHTRPGGATLRADRAINFPDSDLDIAPMTPADHRFLPFVAEHADMLGFSFVARARDVRDLSAALEESGRVRRPATVLKIETRRAFDNLPLLLLEAMRTPPVGVMIARGDLAVECGFERLAEVQEEILWMCEAAHVPAIWATQVLEGLAKKGQPSRAEVTDAAMSERAECVMLNKGPYIIEAVRTLDDILRRMSSHQEKKRAVLRPLRVARGFTVPAAAQVGGAED